MGGGTVLAAQWGHRLSVDIDVWPPGRKTFINLLQHNERNVVGWLGGEPGEPESVDAEQRRRDDRLRPRADRSLYPANPTRGRGTMKR